MPTRPYRGIHPTLEEGAYVDSMALVIGDVVLGKDVSIWPMAVVRGDVNYIRIGARSNVQDNSVLHVTRPYPGSEAGWPLIIGEDVVIAHSVTLHGCTLQNGCFIGMQAMVMDKAVVGEGALVGARSLVTEGTVIPPHTLWVGAPARYKRDLTPDEIAWLQKSAGNYVKYALQYINDK